MYGVGDEGAKDDGDILGLIVLFFIASSLPPRSLFLAQQLFIPSPLVLA